MKITNPIIPGFAPDPSIVLVNGTFILINSSFHVFPGLPIYTSTDLCNWILRGHVLSRPSQLSLSGAFSKLISPPHGPPIFITGGLFAPTIRYFNNKFYVVCTNTYTDDGGKSCFQNFLMSCDEDQIFLGGWSDAVHFDFPGIDPGLFIDESTGKAYLHGSYRTGPSWAPDCSIRQFEINLETGEALSPIRHLWDGAAGEADAEGPHVYFKDDWYYLVTAEGSTFEGHQINIARSRDIWGPYEGCPSNPMLTAHDKDEDILWTGHGDLLHDTQGNWFCVHLGIRPDRETRGRHPLGRETFLTPVSWPQSDWPTISQTQLEFEIKGGTLVANENKNRLVSCDASEDLFIRTPNMDDYTVLDDEKGYILRPRSGDLSTPLGSSTFVGRRQRAVSGSASVSMEVLPTQTAQACLSSGLSIYKDRYRHCSIRIDHATRHLVVDQIGVNDGQEHSCQLAFVELSSEISTVELCIEASLEQYTFTWRPNGTGQSESRQTLAIVDTMAFSGLDMTGTIYGIFATRAQGSSTQEARLVKFEQFLTT